MGRSRGRTRRGRRGEASEPRLHDHQPGEGPAPGAAHAALHAHPHPDGHAHTDEGGPGASGAADPVVVTDPVVDRRADRQHLELPDSPTALPTATPTTSPTSTSAAEAPNAEPPRDNGAASPLTTTTAPFTLRGSFVWGPLMMLSPTLLVRIRCRPKRLHSRGAARTDDPSCRGRSKSSAATSPSTSTAAGSSIEAAIAGRTPS